VKYTLREQKAEDIEQIIEKSLERICMKLIFRKTRRRVNKTGELSITEVAKATKKYNRFLSNMPYLGPIFLFFQLLALAPISVIPNTIVRYLLDTILILPIVLTMITLFLACFHNDLDPTDVYCEYLWQLETREEKEVMPQRK